MIAYIFFIDGKVCHVVMVERMDNAWADRFAKRRGYHSWEVTDSTDMADDVSEIDAMYARRRQTRLTSDETPMQESAEKKAEWLAWAKREFPLGKRVRIVQNNCDGGEAFIGSHGAVSDYDTGSHGEWPMVQVTFDEPIDGHASDFFYADGSDAEIVAG